MKYTSSSRSRSSLRPGRPLWVGFVPLTDCAPVVMAQELGLYAAHGLHVELKREVGWATVRDRIISGELEASPAPAGLVFATTLGLSSVATPCVTGLVLNLHGNAITLSERLREAGVRDGATLGASLRRGGPPLVLGVPSPYSTHHFVLRKWLRAQGLEPGREVQIVSVPPPQMFPNLEQGHLDGYCVGEPWNSLAVLKRKGWCVATSAEIARHHPEKVLMVRQDFATERAQEHRALLAALLEACHYCDQPENRERVLETLAQPQYVPAPIHALRMSMGGTFDFGHGRREKHPDFNIFSRHGANAPDAAKAAWVVKQMEASGVLPDPGLLPADYAQTLFRPDLYASARALVPHLLSHS